MDANDYQIVKDVFEQAIDLPAGERPTFIASRLAHAPNLRAEVEGLLTQHERTNSAVETGAGLSAMDLDHSNDPAARLVGRASEPAGAEAAADAVNGGRETQLIPGGGPSHDSHRTFPVLQGAYRLLRRIGEGGMGVIYEAEQAFPRRRVALKAIRPGLATRSMLRRFHNEVQLLARLHHPGIAQIYEAGYADEVNSDEAFFVMELVNGLPLTEYAQGNKLTTNQRLQLMHKVCVAVEHAHQRGVIHRDLKPGNVLVTAAGEPKILDFGVARAVDDDPAHTHVTREGQIIGTPSYMSPEQISGERGIDTRTDVYALGVICYQLLSGGLPYDLANTPIHAAARTIRETNPLPLSKLRRDLRGDIEVIIARAMHRDRERRYPSAGALADDIERYLTGRAIIARQDSSLYVMRKQISRHRWPFAAAGAALVALITLSVLTTINAREQRRLADAALAANAAATKERDRANEAGSRLSEELAVANIERARLEVLGGNVPLAEDLVWRAALTDRNSLQARWALWDLHHRSGTLWTISGPSDPSAAFAWSSLQRAAIGTASGAVVMYDLAQRKQIWRSEPLGDRVSVMAGAADGTTLAALANGRMVVLNRNGMIERELSPAGKSAVQTVLAAAFGGDGNIVVVGCFDGMIRIWDRRTADEPRSWKAHDEAVLALAISSDSQFIATGPSVLNDGAVARIWGADDGALLHEFAAEHGRKTLALAFTPDGSELFASTGAGSTLKFDIATKAETKVPSVVSTAARIFTFDPTGSTCLQLGGEVPVVLDTTNRKLPRALARQRASPIAGCWLDTHTAVVVLGDGTIRAIDTVPEAALTRIGVSYSWCFGMAFTQDGRKLAIGHNGVSMVDTGDIEKCVSTDVGPSSNRVRAMKFLRDNQTLVLGSINGATHILNTATSKVLATLPSTHGETYALDIDPTETLIASGHRDGAIVLWDRASLRVNATFPMLSRRIEGLCFSPDGKHLVSSGSVRSIVVWDVAKQSILRKVPTSDDPWAVAFSPDGKTLGVSTQAGTVDLFDADTYELKNTVRGHARLIPGLAFSPDGKYFATGSEDGTMKLWELSTGRALLTLDPNAGTVINVLFDPSGRYLVGTTSVRFAACYDLRAYDEAVKCDDPYQRHRLNMPAASFPGAPKVRVGND